MTRGFSCSSCLTMSAANSNVAENPGCLRLSSPRVCSMFSVLCSLVTVVIVAFLAPLSYFSIGFG